MTKAPERFDPKRRGWKPHEWPRRDQEAWEVAIREGDILDEEGPAAHWSSEYRRTSLQCYGRWIGWLAWSGQLDPDVAPADRVTPDIVRAYFDHLRTLDISQKTIQGMLVGMKVTIQVMAPDRDWRWLQDKCNAVQRWAKPSKDKRLLVRSSEEMYQVGLAELQRVRCDCPDLEDAIAYRDVLMFTLMVARPLRHKNFQNLELGRHLTRENGKWRIEIPAEEVKNRRHLEYDVPESLTRFIDHYVGTVRPVFPWVEGSNRLWLNKCGTDLGRRFVYNRITKITKRLFGKAMNPHLFRDCGVTTLVVEEPSKQGMRRPFLGHGHDSTTIRHYDQATQLDASRRTNMIFDDILASD